MGLGRRCGKVFVNGPDFTGHVMDSQTRLIYMQARYYDPVQGRFLTPDPVEASAGSFNRYWYANNNPYKYIDPDGRYAEAGFEALSLTLGVASTYSNFSQGNYLAGSVDAIGVAIDGFLAAIPILPGVVGLGIQASRQTGNAAALSSNLAQDIASGAIADGVKMSTDDALSAASRYLGDGYSEVSSGVFRSADGKTQVRMTDADVSGAHGGGPHMNFESGQTVPKPNGGQSFRAEENVHVYLPDERKP